MQVRRETGPHQKAGAITFLIGSMAAVQPIVMCLS
jgi:hypothetical protein